jgi:hypothetical protein
MICSDRSEKRVTLKGVYHVPSHITNIISTSKVQHNSDYFDGFTDTFSRINTGLEYGSTRMQNSYWLLKTAGSIPMALLYPRSKITVF